MEKTLKLITRAGYDIEKREGVLYEWNNEEDGGSISNHFLLDPLFWQALESQIEAKHVYDWKSLWHSFVDTLAEGKDIDTFFDELTRNTNEK